MDVRRSARWSAFSQGHLKIGWPTYYIDPATCIDCGACVPECPYRAIFPLEEVPSAFHAQGGEVLNAPGLTGLYNGVNHRGQAVTLSNTRVLGAGEVVDLRPSIQNNAAFYR